MEIKVLHLIEENKKDIQLNVFKTFVSMATEIQFYFN